MVYKIELASLAKFLYFQIQKYLNTYSTLKYLVKVYLLIKN